MVGCYDEWPRVRNILQPLVIKACVISEKEFQLPSQETPGRRPDSTGVYPSVHILDVWNVNSVFVLVSFRSYSFWITLLNQLV